MINTWYLFKRSFTLQDEDIYTLINHDVIRGIDPDERRHGYLEQFILVGVGHLNGSPFPAETNLAVAAFDLKQTHINKTENERLSRLTAEK